MSERAYGTLHRKIRLQLLASTPQGTMCPFWGGDEKCPGPMHPGAQLLDLNHSDPAAKLRGEPGDQLAHRACNRRARNKKIPPDVAARRERQAVKDAASLVLVVPGPQCNHDRAYYKLPLEPGSCKCSDPRGHQLANYLAMKDDDTVPNVNHEVPLKCCGAYTHARIW